MANAWEDLESKCYEHLKKEYGRNNSVEAFGSADSTKADIAIRNSMHDSFYVEVKSEKAQCCQFVLFPNADTEHFDFSKDNKVPLSKNCEKIIAHMNATYKTYCKVGKKGIPVNVDSAILYGLVTDFYQEKNVKFFMTEGNELMIFPIDRFSEYFDIEAVYRCKTSGSSEPTQSTNTSEILQGMANDQIKGELEYKFVAGKIRCFLHADKQLHGHRTPCASYTYQYKDNNYSKLVQRKSDYVFEVRRLSNTSNPNVICQLSLKKTYQQADDLKAFEQMLVL